MRQVKPESGRFCRNPLTTDRLRGKTVRRPPPLLGEHSETILREFGFEQDDIAASCATNAIDR